MIKEEINQENITLRSTEISDEAFLETLYADLRHVELAAFGWSEEQENAFFKMQFALQKQAYKMQFPGAVYNIVVFDKTAVGRIIVFRGESEIRLVDITLLTPFRGRGIGSFLIEKLKTEAAVSGKTFSLRVLKTNTRAKRLYERLGLTIAEEEDLYFSMQGRKD